MPELAAVSAGRPHMGDTRRQPGAVHFGCRVILSKEEAFGACQVLADAGRLLVRTGATGEADSLGALFELIEERLVGH